MNKNNNKITLENNSGEGGGARRVHPAKLVAGVGIFTALAAAVSFATSFIDIGYLTFDAGDFVIVLASFIYGPLAGVIISAINATVSFLYSGTGPWGLLMDFVSSGVFAFVAGFIYSRKRNFTMAIIGIYSAIVATTAVMMPMNILVTPLYTGAPREFIIKELPVFLLPFNFVKALFNGSVVLLLYKPLVTALRRARLISPSRHENLGTAGGSKISRATVLALSIGGASMLVGIGGLVALALLKSRGMI